MTNTRIFRETRRVSTSVHMLMNTVASCALYTVVERTFSRVLVAASISCSRRAYSSSNVNPIYGKFLPFFLLFLLFPPLSPFSLKFTWSKAIHRDRTCADRSRDMGVHELVIAVLSVFIGAYLFTGKRRRFIYLIYKTLPRDVLWVFEKDEFKLHKFKWGWKRATVTIVATCIMFLSKYFSMT